MSGPGKPLRMQPAELRSASSKMDAAGQDLGAALDALKDGLAGVGDCAGNDESGKKFKETYDPSSKVLLDAMKQLAEGFGDIKKNLADTAENTENTDSRAGTGIEEAGSGLRA